VQQAREALEVYYERFRVIALAPRPGAVAAPTDGKPAAPLRGAILSSPGVEHMAIAYPRANASLWALTVRPQVRQSSGIPRIPDLA
jgi:hypothetical protein